MTDWRLPENRREAFQRFYSFHLKYRTHPGCVYFILPALAEAFDLDADGRAWLVWLNGNTQNPVTTQLLLEAAPRPQDWRKACDFWNDNFTKLEWDTDRRHQKSKFADATEKAFEDADLISADGWANAAAGGWPEVWKYAFGQPYMGRLSAWSMIEYARILLPDIPDADTWLLDDQNGSKSHRNGLAFIKGYDSVYWESDAAATLGIVEELADFGDELLAEARVRSDATTVYKEDISRLTMESALCTYKSWHKPGRRYPNVYADMHYLRLKKAEDRFNRTFLEQWEARWQNLPPYLRLESTPADPGLCVAKQNFYLETGQPIMMHHDWPDMANAFNDKIGA